GGLGRLQQGEPIFVGLLQRLAARVDVIEDAELHVAFPPTLSRNFWPEPMPAKAKPSIAAPRRLSPSRGPHRWPQCDCEPKRQGMGRGGAGERARGEGRNAGGMVKERAMDTRDLHDKGLKLRREMFGRDTVEQRMNAFGAFGEPLQNMINAYAYGDVWSRPALPLKTKSLAAIAMTAAIGRANELRVHVNGALANGCTAEEIRDILLLVALYCGIPAAIEGHRIALDVLRERGAM